MQHLKPLLLFIVAVLCAFAAFLCFGIAVRILLLAIEERAVWAILLVPCTSLIAVLLYEILWLDQKIGECGRPWLKN